jgi:hypothetical protein
LLSFNGQVRINPLWQMQDTPQERRELLAQFRRIKYRVSESLVKQVEQDNLYDRLLQEAANLQAVKDASATKMPATESQPTTTSTTTTTATADTSLAPSNAESTCEQSRDDAAAAAAAAVATTTSSSSSDKPRSLVNTKDRQRLANGATDSISSSMSMDSISLVAQEARETPTKQSSIYSDVTPVTSPRSFDLQKLSSVSAPSFLPDMFPPASDTLTRKATTCLPSPVPLPLQFSTSPSPELSPIGGGKASQMASPTASSSPLASPSSTVTATTHSITSAECTQPPTSPARVRAKQAPVAAVPEQRNSIAETLIASVPVQAIASTTTSTAAAATAAANTTPPTTAPTATTTTSASCHTPLGSTSQSSSSSLESAVSTALLPVLQPASNESSCWNFTRESHHGASLSVVHYGNADARYLIGGQIAVLLKRETGVLYRCLKMRGFALERASAAQIEFMHKSGAIRPTVHAVTYIPYAQGLKFVGMTHTHTHTHTHTLSLSLCLILSLLLRDQSLIDARYQTPSLPTQNHLHSLYQTLLRLQPLHLVHRHVPIRLVVNEREPKVQYSRFDQDWWLLRKRLFNHNATRRYHRRPLHLHSISSTVATCN